MIKKAALSRLALWVSSLVLLVIFSFATTVNGFAQTINLVQLSLDTFVDAASQHQTEVEPGAAAHGNTIVTAFQVARIFGGGGADIGFATSQDGGKTWTNGYLPGLTIYWQGGTNSAASDASVAYDAKHNVWLISTLPIGNNDLVATSRSLDGGLTWSNPVYVTNSINSDKDWITCDNWPMSPFYGNCYTEWDSPAQGDLLYMSTSSDGGATWGAAKTNATQDSGIGGQPLVLPNGTVVVGYADFSGMSAFSSTNGGVSWNASVSISGAPSRGEDGGLRSAGLPSAAIDGGGVYYMSWPDCRFRSGCSENDIVYSTSTDGTHWSAVQRVPIDPVTSTVDHFIHGLGIDPNTAGNSAHLGLAYYFYPNGNCGNSCSLRQGYIESTDGGQTWGTPVQLGGAMQLNWLPNTFSGRMVADYTATVFSNGKGYPVFVLAYPQVTVRNPFRESVFTIRHATDFPDNGLRFSSAQDKEVPGVKGTRIWEYYDLDHQYPIHPGTVAAPAEPDNE